MRLSEGYRRLQPPLAERPPTDDRTVLDAMAVARTWNDHGRRGGLGYAVPVFLR